MSNLPHDAPSPEMNTFVNERALVDRLLVHLEAVYSPWGRLAVTSEFFYQRGKTDVIAVDDFGNVIAFEAKLTKWRDALQQAYRNTCFATRSYVVLPQETAWLAQRYAGEFARRNVGLCYVDKNEIVVLEEASAQTELEALMRRQKHIEELEKDREALLKSMAEIVPDALEDLTPQERNKIYRMLRLEVAPFEEGYEVGGAFCSSGLTSRKERRKGLGRLASRGPISIEHREQQSLGAWITLPRCLPEMLVPNVVYLPLYTPTTSIPLNPPGARGWQVIPALV